MQYMMRNMHTLNLKSWYECRSLAQDDSKFDSGPDACVVEY